MSEHSPDTLAGLLKAAAAGIAAAVGGVLVLRKRMSGDAADIAGDKARRADIERLQARDSEMRRQLRDDTLMIGELTGEKLRLQGEVEHWRAEATRLTNELHKRNRALSPEQRKVVDTGFAPLDDGGKP